MGKRSKKEKKEKRAKGKRTQPQQNPFDKKGRKGRGKGKTKQDKNWDKYFKEFQTFLEPRGVFMRDVEGDGNCLFRSIADYIDGDESKHQEYREMALEYITKHKDYFAMFLLDDENIDEYIKDMSEDGTWGGHFELVALSAVLKVRFCLHIKDKEPFVVKSSEMNLKGTKMIHLAYHVDEHYSCVRKIGDDEKAPAEPIPITIDDESDSDSDSSEGDSTEGSDKEMSQVTEEVEKLHLQDKRNKNKKGKNEEESKSNSKENNKSQKNKDRKEEKNKNQKRKGR